MNDPVQFYKRMSPATYALNAALIRLAKGMISTWEEWVKLHAPHIEPEMDPDPIEFFNK